MSPANKGIRCVKIAKIIPPAGAYDITFMMQKVPGMLQFRKIKLDIQNGRSDNKKIGDLFSVVK